MCDPIVEFGRGVGSVAPITRKSYGSGSGSGILRNVAILQRFEIETLQDPSTRGVGATMGAGAGVGVKGTQRFP